VATTFESCVARQRVERVLDRITACFTNEDDLQAAVGEAMHAAGIEFDRERILAGKAGRIDFLTTDSVGIECKVRLSITAALPQLFRYCDAPECRNGVVLVTTKATHQIPLVGLPITVVLLRGGIA
jgi:hypothetical protein